jgi:survival motor neuron protein
MKGPPPLPGMKGPPPPPGGKKGAPSAPAKPTKVIPVPAVKMKGLNWTKIPPSKVNATIFGEFGDLMDIDVDFSEIENQFQAKVIEKKDPAAGDAKKAAGPVQLVDPKVGQNLSIWLSRFKCGLGDIVNGVKNLDESMFEKDQLKGLIPLLPTSEDFMNIKEYIDSGKELSRLGKPELFFLEVQKLDGIEQRVKAFVFKLEYPTKKTDVKADLEQLRFATKEVRTSKKFLKVMETILVLGNFVNGGTFRANFTGFKMETLTKLGDTKGLDNKYTLMHYLANHLEKKSTAISDFPTELSHVSAGARVSLQQLTADVNTMSKDLDSVDKTMSQLQAEPGDQFVERMSQFLFVAKEDFKAIQKDIQQVEADFKSLADWFGEDPAKKTPEELFGTVNEFVTQYEKSREEIRKAAEAAEKEKKKEAEREKRRLQTEAAKQKTAAQPGAQNMESVVDDLLSTVRDGDAFRNRRKRVAI